ncbi:glyoxylase-like metal-dependent hydrolase (beta-lactamase superfamily II) [Nitrosomonas oligotropha]|uniref:Glyoxylase-like metal-dependent hydrolase (Beta-lactamase superfamily II) n=1 Tax=Nitrosomonas oligotropha TaxID=42354 RepID=A0A2T5HXX4_9PROT|nr:MBL fold metallo-hydrolase [Nitrosomonas oligotropha]PTQ76318.1 glyoxylase-like metal-dependent hydrolase (beta-lactamase superfamily II) [Nitrosomonas oligotropha]
MSLPLVIDYEHGISAIDAQFHRPKRAAIHLIVEKGVATLVDTGTSFSIPGVIASLEHKGIAIEDVAYVILTHIHLDHAGGASECMRLFPNAKLVVHPRGASHMANPARLVAGAMGVYGEAEFKRVYGEIYPIDAARIIEAPDESRIDLNGRSLLFLDTPGHARHHSCIFDERSQSFFTGDTFGVSYREFDVDGLEFVFPTTSPVQFDPAAAHASIDRIMRYQPRHAYLTHYSQIGNLARHAQSLHELLDAHVDIAQRAKNDEDRQAVISKALWEILLQRLTQQGCQLPLDAIDELLRSDIRLNAQGLIHWLDQPTERFKQL